MPDTMMPLTTTVDVLVPDVRQRSRRAWRTPAVVRRLGSTVLLLALWQAASAAGLISPRVLAPPSAIVAAAWTIILDGTLPHNLLISLGRVVAGLAIALGLGVPLALLSGLSRLGEDAVDAPLQMVRTLPHLALVPLFILWFGIGETPKIALVALGSIFPIYLNLVAAIRGVDPKLIEAGRTLGLSQFEMIRHVVLPGALPGFLVGLRYAVGVAWLSLVVGEQINADSGIGYMMMDARDFLRTDIILVGLLTYALLGPAGRSKRAAPGAARACLAARRPMRGWRRAASLVLCFLLAALLAPARADTPHPATLRIGYQRIGPLVILQQQHRLEQALAPTTVQWIEFASGPPLMEALNAGAIDFGYGGDMPPIFAAAAGVDFVFVAFQPLPGENEGLLLPPGSTVTTVEGLRGRMIAVTKGSSAHNFIVRILAAHRMTPADVQLRYLQPSDAAAAFARGSVDAWAIWDPYFAIAQRAPGVRLLTDGVGVAPSNNFFFARRSYAQDNPALMAQLVDEINGAASWAHDHPQELASVMTAVTGVEPGAEAVAAARGAYTAAFLTPAVVSQEQAIADRFANLHIIPGAVDIAAHVYHPPASEKRSE